MREKREEYKISNHIDKTINNEHDKIFRKILDNRREAKVFINKTLGININEDDIEKYNSSFVSYELKNRESDIVYKIKNKDIFILIEHQTKVDYKVPLRILEYSMELMKSAINYEKFGKKNYKLPLVIPIVLYTGKKKWKVKESIREVQEESEYVKRIEFARYNLVDVNDYSINELLEDKSFLTKAMLIEKAKNDTELTEFAEKIAQVIKDDNRTYGEDIKEIFTLIIDLVLKRKIGKDKSNELIETIKGGNDKMLAVLDMIDRENKRIYSKGKMEGLKQRNYEIAKKMKKEKFTINQIIEITGLKKNEIECIKND